MSTRIVGRLLRNDETWMAKISVSLPDGRVVHLQDGNYLDKRVAEGAMRFQIQKFETYLKSGEYSKIVQDHRTTEITL